MCPGFEKPTLLKSIFWQSNSGRVEDRITFLNCSSSDEWCCFHTWVPLQIHSFCQSAFSYPCLPPGFYSFIGLPDLVNKSTGCPVKFELQINKKQFSVQSLGHTYTTKFFIIYLKFTLSWMPCVLCGDLPSITLRMAASHPELGCRVVSCPPPGTWCCFSFHSR